MWQMSTAPVLGGGFGHFYAYAPVKIKYAVNRYSMETKRIFDVADRRLADSRFLAGDDYTIADIANFAWMSYFVSGEAYGEAKRFLDIPSYKNVGRWAAEIGERKGVKRGRIVNRDQEGFLLSLTSKFFDGMFGDGKVEVVFVNAHGGISEHTVFFKADCK